MNAHEFDKWGKTIARNWEHQDFEANIILFKHCQNSRETPFSLNAAATPDGIRLLWEEIKIQSQICVSVETVCFNESTAVFRYRAEFLNNGTPHRSAGIWTSEFEAGQCTSFEQYFNVDC